MSSLRTRLLTGVLVLSFAGLVVMGAVTYAEQKSFLLSRVNQQAKAAVPALSQRLDALGYRPPPTSLTGVEASVLAQQHPHQHGPQQGRGAASRPPNNVEVSLPPGTYGQRRLANGTVIGKGVQIRYSSSEHIPAAPVLPAKVPIGRLFTVHAAGTSDTHYRVFVGRDPEDSGLTVAAVPLSDVDQTLGRLLLVEGLVVAGVLLALGLTAFFVVRLGLRPLDRMEVTAGAIAGGELSHRVSPATTRTEVGRLGVALNRMLDRLEGAFSEREASEDRLRQFLADASHELRTPLASIRGYAELFRMGATDEEGTRVAMRRIEDEAARMGVLVEDLLTLARLDEAPEQRREPVDVAQMARDAVKDAQATAPERPIEIRAPDSAAVMGDPNQLHQVIANLMRNALVHTPAGTAIEVTVETEGDDVTLRVRDHGPGLPAGGGPHLFDRFWRAEGGRERGRSGAGLGLAIASEIVGAHHGRISADDAPGGGAVFTVVLPVGQREPEPQASR